MTVTALPLIQSKDCETAQTAQYTSPSGVRTLLDKFTATNTTAGALSISVNLVPSGGAAGSTNLITKTKALAAGETYPFPELVGHALAAGDFISTLASAAGITIRASGRQVS